MVSRRKQARVPGDARTGRQRRPLLALLRLRRSVRRRNGAATRYGGRLVAGQLLVRQQAARVRGAADGGKRDRRRKFRRIERARDPRRRDRSRLCAAWWTNPV